MLIILSPALLPCVIPSLLDTSTRSRDLIFVAALMPAWLGRLKSLTLKTRIIFAGAATILLAIAILGRPTTAQNKLKVSYSANGVQQISYADLTLEDLDLYPADSFHIWHMKMTDLAGKVVSEGQNGWGEVNNGRTWNLATKTWTYPFNWGSIQLQYVERDNTLDMNVTETNLPNSGVILDGAVIYPLVLHLPQLPVSFHDQNESQLAFNTTGPSVIVADYGAGEVVSVVPDAAKPLYSGFLPAGNGSYTPLISGTPPDNLASFQPHAERPVRPGQTETFTVSLRFAPSGRPALSLASDAYASWAKSWPQQLQWTDRRPIGTVYLATSPPGNKNQPGGYLNNPRRYFTDGDSNDFDITTGAGLVAFQRRILAQAGANVINMRKLGAQGSITWDIEGEQYPQNTSYVCEPDEIAKIAPEMESAVAVQGSPYFGMKLDDAYFKTMRDAGFRVGVCVRPQHFALNRDGTAQQTSLDNSATATELMRKIHFAHERWGATLFYVDSSVESDGAILDAATFEQILHAFPDALIIPEETSPKHYAYTAAFQSFLFHGNLGTEPSVYAYYPHAFSANLINDVDPAKLDDAIPQLTNAVKKGDILMGHVDYWQANNGTIVSIYSGAEGANASPTAKQ